MKHAVVCFALFVAIQCLTVARAQYEATTGFDPRRSPSQFAEVRKATVTTTTTTTTTTARGSAGLNVIHEPKSREDHDLIVGACGLDNFNALVGEGMFAATEPENRTTSMGVRVKFTRDDAEIVCIRTINKCYDVNDEDVGGYPYVDEGGIGANFVQMRFESLDGQEMVFQYEIFAWLPEVTTTTPSGGAEAIGKSRDSWLLLTLSVLFFKSIVMGSVIIF